MPEKITGDGPASFVLPYPQLAELEKRRILQSHLCFYLTVTRQAAVLPLLLFAVMVAVPKAFAVTLPAVSPVAMDTLLLIQVSVLFFASAGITVAVS